MSYQKINKIIDFHIQNLEARLESLVIDEVRQTEANLRLELVELKKLLEKKV